MSCCADKGDCSFDVEVTAENCIEISNVYCLSPDWFEECPLIVGEVGLAFCNLGGNESPEPPGGFLLADGAGGAILTNPGGDKLIVEI